MKRFAMLFAATTLVGIASNHVFAGRAHTTLSTDELVAPVVPNLEASNLLAQCYRGGSSYGPARRGYYRGGRGGVNVRIGSGYGYGGYPIYSRGYRSARPVYGPRYSPYRRAGGRSGFGLYLSF